MTKTNSKLWLTGITLVLTSGLALAKGHGERREKFQEKMLEHMTTELKLTPDQITKIKEIHKANEETIKALRTSITRAQDHLDKIMQDDKASDDQIKQVFDEVQVAKQKAGENHFQDLLKIRALLSKEQREKFRSHMKERKGKMNHRFGGPLEESETVNEPKPN